MKPQTKYHRIKKKIADLSVELSRLQAECEHPNAVGKYESNTGNYDPHCDSYWIECKCPDCGKFWMVDSKLSEYRSFDRIASRKMYKEWPEVSHLFDIK